MSSLDLVPEHLLGLSIIVKMRGGIDSITNKHLRLAVSVQGLYDATRHLKAPPFPFASNSPVVVRDDGLLKDLRQPPEAL